MKAFLDFEEKSVEKAVQKACAELNIPKEKLKYDIISYGSSGIFGLVGTKKALIRVAVPRNAEKESSHSKSVKADGAQSTPAADDISHREAVTALVDEAFGEIGDTDKRAPAEDKAIEEESDTFEEESGITETLDNESSLRVANDFLLKIIDILAIDVNVDTGQDPRHRHIFIKGKDSGFLIGKKGQTLEAIQYLVDKVVNKQCGKGAQVSVDVEGYIESRKAELKELAKRLADKAQRTGKPSTISRMNAQERRVVHLALKNNKAVRTQSIGDGYYRKLIIFPKKKSPKKKAKEAPVSN